MALTTLQVQQLYLGYYGRPADPVGLAYWQSQTLEAAKAGFAASAEFTNQYAGMTVAQQVAQVYVNLLGREADVNGLLYWSNEIVSGRETIGTLVMSIQEDALGRDVTTLQMRTDYSAAFTDALDTTGEVVGYSGQAAAEAARAAMANIVAASTGDTSTLTAALASLDTTVAGVVAGGGVAGQTFMLTTSVDNVVGTNGNDTINAVLNGANSTLTALDVIDGGAGTDTLNIDEVVAAALPGGLTIKNVENAVVRSAGDATVDSTTWAGLTSLKATQATTVDLTAATTTAVEVSGATGATVAVNGGSTVAVTTSTADQAVTIGEDAVSAGAVSVTHTKQGTADIQVDGGTNVTVVASGVSSGDILIGQTIGGATVAADQPSGDISVTSTGAAYTAAYVSAALGPITIDGGKTVSVTQSATSDSSAVATDTSAGTVTQSAVTVNGGASTTSVTIKQDAAVTADNAVAAVAGAQEVQTVTFGAMTAAQTLVINGLTFTASKALTAAEVAAEFAGLTNGTTQGSAPAGNGVYSGTFSTISGSTGAVTTTATASTVTFTSTAKVDVAALTIAGNAAGTSVTATTNGSAETTAVTGVMGVVGGEVTIEGNITGTDVLASVSLDGYGASSEIDSDALTSLTLANSKADLDVDNLAATTLALSLNNIGTGSSLDIGSTYTTLNVTATGANSDVTLVAGGVQTLTVAGDKSVDLSGATLSALKTVTVSGSAGLTIDASGATVTAVNTTATTGTVTATVDASNATYTGGVGVDNVTLSSTTVSKAVNTGAGDDKITLASGTTSLTEAIVAGDGTDTLVMVAADAATASAATTFETKIDGFEKLSLSAVTSGASNSIDLSNMDDISYVVSAGSAVNTAQVTEIALAQGAGIVGMEAADSFAVTISGTTFTDTGTARASLDAIGTAMAALIDANAAYAATYDAANDKIVVTAAAAGTAFSVTNAGTFTDDTTVVDNGTVTGVATTTTPNVANGALTLTKMANGGTLELTGAGTGATVTMTDATGTADSFNIVTKVDAADVSFGTVAVAGVETVNITATDTTPVNTVTGAATISKATLTVSDADVKSVVVTGNSDLDLTAAGASLTTVNASALTGKLAFSSAVNSAVITGGSAADTLTGSGNSQTLNGGAGADTLIVTGDLATLSGGAGNDVFNIGNATTNVNSYATTTDLAAGDLIKFSAGAADFVSAKVTLGDTAVFQDLANAAIANSDTGDVAWFQFSGNTYVIENVSNNASAFVNNTDIIVKITGLVDLSTASFSSSADTLLIA